MRSSIHISLSIASRILVFASHVCEHELNIRLQNLACSIWCLYEQDQDISVRFSCKDLDLFVTKCLIPNAIPMLGFYLYLSAQTFYFTID